MPVFSSYFKNMPGFLGQNTEKNTTLTSWWTYLFIAKLFIQGLLF